MAKETDTEQFSKDVQKYLDEKKFGRQEHFEQLLRWSEQVQALGGIFSALGFYEKENAKTDAMQIYGENYGEAIQSIGKLIESKVNEIYHSD